MTSSDGGAIKSPNYKELKHNIEVFVKSSEESVATKENDGDQ